MSAVRNLALATLGLPGAVMATAHADALGAVVCWGWVLAHLGASGYRLLRP